MCVHIPCTRSVYDIVRFRLQIRSWFFFRCRQALCLYTIINNNKNRKKMRSYISHHWSTRFGREIVDSDRRVCVCYIYIILYESFFTCTYEIRSRISEPSVAVEAATLAQQSRLWKSFRKKKRGNHAVQFLWPWRCSRLRDWMLI